MVREQDAAEPSARGHAGRPRFRTHSVSGQGLPLRPLRDTVMAIANMPVAITRPDGRRVTVSLFEMLVLRLAAGKTSRRISPMPFITLVIACAEKDKGLPPRREAASAECRKAGDADARTPMDARLVSGSDADVEDAVAYLLRMTRMATRRERP